MPVSKAGTKQESITENLFDPRFQDQLSNQCKHIYSPSHCNESEDIVDNNYNNNAARNADYDNSDKNASTKPEQEDPQTQPMEIIRDCQCGNRSLVHETLPPRGVHWELPLER